MRSGETRVIQYHDIAKERVSCLEYSIFSYGLFPPLRYANYKYVEVYSPAVFDTSIVFQKFYD